MAGHAWPCHGAWFLFYEVLYTDKQKCTIVENMGWFSLAYSHFLHQEDRVLDFSGREKHMKGIRGHAFSPDVIMSWNHGHVRLMRMADQGLGPRCQRGWRGSSWWLTIRNSWPTTHDPMRGS
jgi:hypothetical protein